MRLIKSSATKISFVSKKDLYSSFIEQIVGDNLISVTLCNGCKITGKVVENLDTYLHISQFLDNGLLDGETIILQESISNIQFNTEKCKKIFNNIKIYQEKSSYTDSKQ